MNRKAWLLFLPLLLISCSKADTSSIKILCPSGAPSLAFYTLAANEKFVTTNNTTDIPKELGQNNYDCVVFDSINGLNVLKKGSNFKLASLVFHLSHNFFKFAIIKCFFIKQFTRYNI